jgi:hypothetical protein
MHQLNEFFSGTGFVTVGISGIPGDFNNDYVVDSRDYAMWRDNFGQPAGALQNDNTGAEIGTMQYVAWRSNAGIGAGGGSSLAGQAAVPEPASLLISLVGAVAMISLRAPQR